MTYDGTILGVYEFLTSRAFRRVQERVIQSLGERVMAVQRHEGMKQHKGPRTLQGPYAPACPRSGFFGAFPRTWVREPCTCMGPPRTYVGDENGP